MEPTYKNKIRNISDIIEHNEERSDSLFCSISIIYLMVLQESKSNEFTPFQGFSPGLPIFAPMMHRIVEFPADIIEPTMEFDRRLAHRRTGAGMWAWAPINLSTILGEWKVSAEYPYIVTLTANEDVTKKISSWRKGLRIPPIHLSIDGKNGGIPIEKFTLENLRQHLIAMTRKAKKIRPKLDVTRNEEILAGWLASVPRPSSLQLHSHNVTVANEMTLASIGEEAPEAPEGRLSVASPDKYIQAITQSSEAVMALWPQAEDYTIYRAMPKRPDIFLVAPSMYRGIAKKLERVIDDPAVKATLRSLDRQRGYTVGVRATAGAQTINKIGPLLSLRGFELKLFSNAVGLSAAGTLAATIRLPPSVNRTAGVVGQLASFLRSHDNPPPSKAARVFKVVQQALENTIPEEHRALLRRSRSGIKIISDAPLEWIPIDGVPLGIRYDVSRINTTPGNLFIEKIRPPKPVFIKPKDFRNYLVLSMFDEGDKIAPYLRVGAVNTLDQNGDHIIGQFKSPRTPDEFAEAIRNYDGPMLIIDSHAVHEDGNGPGGLLIGGKAFDVWSLRREIVMPPVVVLSACDTHPFDRSHATVANGILACGALAVIATAVPIRAPQAARFIMRLINRAVHFGQIVSDMGLSVPWSHIVGGLLRMEFATDIIRGFEKNGGYDEVKGSELLLSTNLDLNPLREDWYERLMERVCEAASIDRTVWDRGVADIVAASDAIRYLHLGNPEAILIAGLDTSVATRAASKSSRP